MVSHRVRTAYALAAVLAMALAACSSGSPAASGTPSTSPSVSATVEVATDQPLPPGVTAVDTSDFDAPVALTVPAPPAGLTWFPYQRGGGALNLHLSQDAQVDRPDDGLEVASVNATPSAALRELFSTPALHETKRSSLSGAHGAVTVVDFRVTSAVGLARPYSLKGEQVDPKTSYRVYALADRTSTFLVLAIATSPARLAAFLPRVDAVVRSLHTI